MQAAADPLDDLPAGLAAGDVVAEKYAVERVLGAGGMGVVLAAEHLVLRRRVAIKVLRRSVARRPGAIERFLREARAASSIDDEHVARVSDVGTLADGTPFMVMEHLSGTDLADVLAARGALPVAEAIDYLLQACEAVAEAHRRRIVHRDLKPSNLFLARREGGARVKVLDFGVAKALEAAPDEASLTATGSTMGSPRYMSPEQVRNAKGVDHRADVWALGITLHELATGRAPFDDEHPSALCAMIAADEPRLLLDGVEGGAALEPIVRRCLEKEPAKRFQDVASLVEALAPLASPGVGAAARTRIEHRSAGGLDDVETLPGADESEPIRATTGAGSSTVDPVVQRDAAPGARPPRSELATTEPASPRAGAGDRRAPVVVGSVAIALAAALIWARSDGDPAAPPAAARVDVASPTPSEASLAPSAPAPSAPPDPSAAPEPSAAPSLGPPSSSPLASSTASAARPSSPSKRPTPASTSATARAGEAQVGGDATVGAAASSSSATAPAAAVSADAKRVLRDRK